VGNREGEEKSFKEMEGNTNCEVKHDRWETVR